MQGGGRRPGQRCCFGVGRRRSNDVVALRLLASLEERRGDTRAAIAAYQKLAAAEAGEALAATALRLSSLCDEAGCPQEAHRVLQRAVGQAPENGALRTKLREVLNALGAGAELATMVIEDARRATDGATRAGLLLQAARLLLDTHDVGGRELRSERRGVFARMTSRRCFSCRMLNFSRATERSRARCSKEF